MHALSRIRRPAVLQRFAQSESGGAIVLALIFFTLMVMMGGLAVDLMRYEVRRTTLQQTTDRAVLAAASMGQKLEPEDVVRDYFLKAGLADKLKDVSVDENFNSRSVIVHASSEVDPFFMQMLGINELDAPAYSRAQERITDIEVSLVLDISGSMDSNNRLINLKPAAREFVDLIFDGSQEGRTTMSIIPYSGQVNLGQTMASVFNYTPIQSTSWCFDLPSTTFTSTTVSQSTAIIQASHVDPFTGSGTRAPSLFFCPPASGNTVLPFSDSPTALKNKISGLDADGNTSIDIGVKWGMTLLDPASNGIVTSLISKGVVNSTYSDRPINPSAREVIKALVVMTDGENTEETVIKTAYRTGTSNIYRQTSTGKLAAYYNVAGSNDYYMPDNSSSTRWQSKPFNSSTGWTQLSWPDVWKYASLQYVAQKLYADPKGESYSTWMTNFRTTASTATKNTRLQQICTATKNKNIQVFAIAFGAPSGGKTQLKSCVSPETSRYYEVDDYEADGGKLMSVFRAIASQINHLRLTQ
ncbi:MAG: hypothetical protein DI533_00065 [Cereibacter sphaeroides]|uniref:Putative Flp pilus-assembly TadG-like N-terminal domain-containing protein n=1 Tax=Cereibacter sphaeroides TaxID=1063 RepID=A0A2W5SIH6_CERSP|nr:MAG: hypothetical protein DI533_00065 [Cereibacter sphaeroides]